jgi:hypothetical protein
MPRLSAQPFHRLRISGTGTGTGTFTGAAGIQGQALAVFWVDGHEIRQRPSKPSAAHAANRLGRRWQRTVTPKALTARDVARDHQSRDRALGGSRPGGAAPPEATRPTGVKWCAAAILFQPV